MRQMKGFTLIEVIITSVIVGFLGLGSMLMVANSTTILNRGYKQALSNGNIQSIMHDISVDIKGAIILNTTNSKDLIIVFEDTSKIRWYFENGMIYREGTDGKVKKIILQGASDITVDGTFTPSITGKYYKTDVDFKMQLSDGNTYQVGNVSNTYYCRHEFAGFI